ncbi:hypothetical protein AAFF_G00136770 [Aldrovandia affinis]|uniref:Uncharacterized protein n=1 Tax=Aldrovandia affinis TaxID=143900 RepID=A0AAD7TBX4_9TELE|nr:hypothetical protein AAFF_G00136770 [Aldrovandia affinis]
MKKITISVICLVLTIFFPSAASQETTDSTNSSSCSAEPMPFERLSIQLKDAVDCIETLMDQLEGDQSASLLDSLSNVTHLLQKHQKKACSKFTPKECPAPEIHSNGGLVCVTIADTRYCKPMCNEGFDFAFLRRSRLYEHCNKASGHKWTTQYVGGNKLAICNIVYTRITSEESPPCKSAGASGAYFPKDQDCMKIKSQKNLEKDLIQVLSMSSRCKTSRERQSSGASPVDDSPSCSNWESEFHSVGLWHR